MDNNQTITESAYPIEPVWVLKNTLPSLLGLPFSFFWFMFVMAVENIKKTGGIDQTSFYFMFFIFFIVLPIPFHFFLNILRRRNFHYSLDDRFFNLHQGILSKQNRQIPYGVIQNVILKQDIMDRIFNLSSLRIENASNSGGLNVYRQKAGQPVGEQIGFKSNYVSIPGLMKQNAEILKRIILEKIKTHPIEELGM